MLYHLSLQSLIVRHTGERLSANQVKSLDTDAIADKLEDPIRLGGQLTYLARGWHEGAIAMLEEEVLKHLKPRRDYQLLSSIPGVGKDLASTIALETGAIERFPGPGHYASHARCVTIERVSNGKLKGRGNKHNGNKYLAWAFMEAAHYAAVWSPEIKRFYSEAPGQTAHPGGQEDRGEQIGQGKLSHAQTPGVVRCEPGIWLSFAVAAGRKGDGVKPW